MAHAKRYQSILGIILLVACGSLRAALPAAIADANGESTVALPSLADMLERANPAVVNIATRSTVVEHNR